MSADIAINYVLLAMLLVLLAAIIRMRGLLNAILLMSVYSLIIAIWFMVMDAPDVAFTEAAVGAGVSTLILLGAVLLTRSSAARISWTAMIVPGIAAAAVAALLIFAAQDLPALGDPSAPANAYVGKLYLQSAHADIGAPNVVTAVLASYRGFDTLGETTVIFAAGVAVALLLGFGERALADQAKPPPGAEDHQVVLSVAAKFLIPLIALFAFYTLFHGDLGPGGGFQGGVILAVAVILHALVFGLHDTMTAIRPETVRSTAALGVLIYGGVGIWNAINGGHFLDYDHLFLPGYEQLVPAWLLPGHGAHWGQFFGILIIETGVFLTVAATMVTIFYGFAGRAADRPAGSAP